MPVRLINLFVKNVAAVGKPANRRKFLVIKSAGGASVNKDEHAMTFDDAMFGRRVHKVYMALSERYSALLETIDSIRNSEDEDKPTAVKAAIGSFLDSMTKAMPALLVEMDSEDVEKGALDPAPLVKLRDRVARIIEEIAMLEKDTKKTDKSLWQKATAALAKAMGADDEMVRELERVPIPPPVEVPAELTARLAKADADAVELKKTNDELAKTVAKLHEEAELRKFAEEVSGYKDIGLDPTKDAALLKAVSEKLPKEQADRIREIFKSNMAQIAAGKLFSEVGSSASGFTMGTASEEIDQKVEAQLQLMVKTDTKATREQARDRVFRENPSLYTRWREETSVKI